MLLEGRVGPQTLADGATRELRLGRTGAGVVTDAHGRYYEAAARGRLFMAHAIVTAPVIWSTAAGTGGPLVWNGSTTHNVNILAMSAVITTASGVAGALGLTGNTGQVSAPGTTTAIDSRANLLIGGAASGATPYRVGTVTNAGGFFLPVIPIGTNAVTAQIPTWVDLGGILTIPPNCWASVAGSATLTSLVAQIGLLYEEIPV